MSPVPAWSPRCPHGKPWEDYCARCEQPARDVVLQARQDFETFRAFALTLLCLLVAGVAIVVAFLVGQDGRCDRLQESNPTRAAQVCTVQQP